MTDVAYFVDQFRQCNIVTYIVKDFKIIIMFPFR